MIWDHYIPLAVAGGQFNKQAEQQGSTILDFAGMSPQRLSAEAKAIIQDCVGSGAKRLLVNIDGTTLMNPKLPSNTASRLTSRWIEEVHHQTLVGKSELPFPADLIHRIGGKSERNWEMVEAATSGRDEEALTRQPTEQSNSIAWICGHMNRVTDMFIRHRLQSKPELWVIEGWCQKDACDWYEDRGLYCHRL